MNDCTPVVDVRKRLADVLRALPKREPIRELIEILASSYRDHARAVAWTVLPFQDRHILIEGLRVALLEQLTRLLNCAAALCEAADRRERDKKAADQVNRIITGEVDHDYHALRFLDPEHLEGDDE